MRRFIFGFLALASYVVLLVRWFHDPGEPTPDGFLARSRPVWPFLLVFLVPFGLWIHSLGGRPRAMFAELHGAWGLERRDVLLLAAILAGALAYQLPIVLHPYGALDSDAVLSALVHSSHLNKDRTGVTTAFLLSILGVERALIEADYILTNPLCRKVNLAIPA